MVNSEVKKPFAFLPLKKLIELLKFNFSKLEI